MSRSYIYTVRDTVTGLVVVKGSSEECAKVVGVKTSTMPQSAREFMKDPTKLLKRRYIVTRVPNEDTILYNSKYYKVYLHKTGELVCAGTSHECTKALGLSDVCSFRQLVYHCNAGKNKKWDISAVPYGMVSQELTRDHSLSNSAAKFYAHHRNSKESIDPTLGLWYSVYLRETDEMVCSGTSDECAKALGLKSVGSFRTLVYRSRNGLSSKYEIYSEPYCDDEEEDI